ncbi:MAG: alpha/beta fold hydrolase [Nitrospiraceae bacterium]
MTLYPRVVPRWHLLESIPEERRLFRVTPDTQILGLCHWQSRPRECPTLLLVHGLEGCHDSQYMRGTADKAYRAGCNVIRLNQRNCGDTEHLTPRLYNNGLSEDVRAVLDELLLKDGLLGVWAIGWSMGGNLVLKMAGEAENSVPGLLGVIGICPTIDPETCVRALEQPENRLYEHHFVTRLKALLTKKAHLYPERYSARPLRRITRLREIDHAYTAPDAGFQNAEEYYDGAGARHILDRIRVPTAIITAQDDPFVPFSIFTTRAIRENPAISLLGPEHGGHCAFIQQRRPGEDRHWAEHRIVALVTGQETWPPHFD